MGRGMFSFIIPAFEKNYKASGGEMKKSDFPLSLPGGWEKTEGNVAAFLYLEKGGRFLRKHFIDFSTDSD